MGNAVIAKPSEMTPLTATLLAEVCHRVKLPPGILNIVHGLGAEVGSPIVGHPAIQAISFTGGTATGKIVAATAAPMFKKLSLELGGKNATVILDDVDVDAVVPLVVRAGFANQGQICLCGSRVLVADAIYNEVRDKIVAAVSKMTVGDPATSDMGSLISLDHRKKVEGYIKLATEEGGTILTGGHRPNPELPGAFLRPTVIEGLDIHSRTATEEIFGPVITLHR